MTNYQAAKSLVGEYHRTLDGARAGSAAVVMARYLRSDHRFRGVHPFNEIAGVDALAESLWEPLRGALKALQRRQDVFIAGTNEIDGKTWVCSMGHLMGLLDGDWLGIPAHGRLVFLRYAEFYRIQEARIAETALFFDIVSVMKQAGIEPLPLQTGAELVVVPGPRTRDGVLDLPQPHEESAQTLALVNQMREDLRQYRKSPRPLEVLARTWRDDMLWFGPSGIGSTYTIARYHEQHQYPFRRGLANIQSNGHVCRFAEGKYAAWFGWPNLTMEPSGGFMGLPSAGRPVDMRVVDVYRRDGDKLSENWIFIDLLHWMLQQNVDLLERTYSILPRA
jgi:predicted ester cyclase